MKEGQTRKAEKRWKSEAGQTRKREVESELGEPTVALSSFPWSHGFQI
jgi:hypothetical protein